MVQEGRKVTAKRNRSREQRGLRKLMGETDSI